MDLGERWRLRGVSVRAGSDDQVVDLRQRWATRYVPVRRILDDQRYRSR